MKYNVFEKEMEDIMAKKGPGTPKSEDWSVYRESVADQWRDKQRKVGHPLDYPNKGRDTNDNSEKKKK